jgi:hypothetical protein
MATKQNDAERVTVGTIANARAEQRAITADKAAKEVRGLLRANFDVITKLDPSILEVKAAANDGNRWPAMHPDVHEYVTSRTFRAEANAKHRAK